MGNNVDCLKTLERLMVEHGACIRAIPEKDREIYEAYHVNDPEFSKPDIIRKEVVYLEEFKREMLIVERVPEDAGMFLVETGLGTAAQVRFSGKQYYKTLEEAITAIEKDDIIP